MCILNGFSFFRYVNFMLLSFFKLDKWILIFIYLVFTCIFKNLKKVTVWTSFGLDPKQD